MTSAGSRLPAGAAAVVVDFDAGALLAECVASLVEEGAAPVVVVENGTAEPAAALLAHRQLGVSMVDPGANLGYGSAANRGVAATGGAQYVLVCNPDLRLHPGALTALVGALDHHPAWGIVGPRILTPAGDRYPSVRRFPTPLDAVGHALLGLFRTDNPFSRRYGRAPENAAGHQPRLVDWVSGSCMLVRRSAFEDLGGFDERYFMFAEDLDLCWRAHRAGWGVGFVPEGVVTHHQGVTTARRPYRMLVAHHRSAWRFACVSTKGWRRAGLPVAAVVLLSRLVVACLQEAAGARQRPAA